MDVRLTCSPPSIVAVGNTLNANVTYGSNIKYLLAMEDSPLSITASITGILTFIAAIIASVYVRYKVLKNGYDEISTIMNSTIGTAEETMGNILVEGDNRPEVARMRKHLMDLYRIEITIMSKCAKASGFKIPPVARAMDLEHDNNETQFNRRREGGLLRKLSSCQSIFDIWISSAPELMALVWAIKFVVLAGVTPTLFRWYRVRNEVMDMVQQRNLLRSQILYQQMILLHM